LAANLTYNIGDTGSTTGLVFETLSASPSTTITIGVGQPSTTTVPPITFDAAFGELANELLGWFPRGRVQFGGQNIVSCTPVPINPLVRKRARRLLEGILQAEDVLRWDREGYVEVPSRRFQGGVWRLSKRCDDEEPWINLCLNGVKVASICLHVDGAQGLLEDSLVAKYLLCKFDEDAIERNGNWSWIPRHAAPFPEPNAVPELVFA
jgi:hypothetical protein